MDTMTDDECKVDGNMDNTELEGNERNKTGNVDEANNVTGVSSLTRLRNLAMDVTTKDISWQERIKRRERDDMENTEMNSMDA